MRLLRGEVSKREWKRRKGNSYFEYFVDSTQSSNAIFNRFNLSKAREELSLWLEGKGGERRKRRSTLWFKRT